MNSILFTTATLDFELRKEIGKEGENSKVFIALDKQLNAEIVIKKIHKDKVFDEEDLFSESKRLYDSEHDHVVQIKYACEQGEYIYLAMPFYKNGTLSTILQDKYLTVREILRYTSQFLMGLNNIHTKGLIHFDIKPSNILISDSDQALVSDFGLAKYMNEVGLVDQPASYYLHRPPEDLRTHTHSIAYDIYSSGLTLYRMCNGYESVENQLDAFYASGGTIDGWERLILKGKLPDRDCFLPHIPNKLRAIIKKALHVDPSRRYPTIVSLMNALAGVGEMLDWKYSTSEGIQRWEKEEPSKILTVEVSDKGNIFDIRAFKYIKESGNTFNIKEGNRSNVSADNLNEIIQEVLMFLEV